MVFDDVAKLVNLAHADEDAITAVPASAADIEKIIALPPSLERSAVLMIRFCGLRLADLRRLRRKQFALSYFSTRPRYGSKSQAMMRRTSVFRGLGMQ